MNQLTIPIVISVISLMVAVYSGYDLWFRRKRAKATGYTEADKFVVASAVELLEPYKKRVKELVDYTDKLEQRLRDMASALADANVEIIVLRQQVKELTDHIGD